MGKVERDEARLRKGARKATCRARDTNRVMPGGQQMAADKPPGTKQ